jgi:tetratricopeptide (TPR) repeat protein
MIKLYSSYGIWKVILLFWCLVLCLFTSSYANSDKEMDKDKAQKEAIQIMKKVEVILITYPDSALYYIAQGHKKSKEANNDKLIGRFFELTGKYYTQSNNYAKALEFFHRAENIFDSVGFNRGVASVNNEIGKLYLDIGGLEKAEEYFVRAQENTKTKKNQAILWVNTGNAYFSKGYLGKAMELYLRSKRTFEELHDSVHLSSIMTNLASIYFEEKNYKKALHYYDSAISLKDPIIQWRQIMNCQLGKVATYRATENIDMAKNILLKVSKTGIYNNDNNGYGTIYYEWGLLDAAYGNYNSAEKRYISSLEWFTKANNTIKIAEVLNSLGKIMLHQQRTNKAIDYFNKSLSISEKQMAQALLLENYTLLIKAYLSLNNYKMAYNLQEKYSVLKGKFAIETQQREISFYEAKEQLFKKEQELEKLDHINKQNLIRLEKGKYQKALLVLLIVLTIVIALFIYQKTKNKFLRRQELFKKQKLEIENKLLRSQFNPHFIFNCLNSAQAYISENKLRDAAVYLSRFSRLMRHVLNGTRNELILLDDELKILNLYLEIEKERIGRRFSFHIDCSSNLDPSQVLVPPFIIQPFIENALVHGIAKEEDNSFIHISYDNIKGERIIQCCITDNGAGLNPKAQNDGPKHKSVGLKLVQERLDLYQANYKQKLEYCIEPNKTGKGIEVKITMPYFCMDKNN